MAPIEAFYAYPGVHLLKTLNEKLAADDIQGFSILAQRISTAIISRNYKRNTTEWETSDDAKDQHADRLRRPSVRMAMRRRISKYWSSRRFRNRAGNILPRKCAGSVVRKMSSFMNRCWWAVSRCDLRCHHESGYCCRHLV